MFHRIMRTDSDTILAYAAVVCGPEDDLQTFHAGSFSGPITEDFYTEEIAVGDDFGHHMYGLLTVKRINRKSITCVDQHGESVKLEVVL